MVFAKGFSRVGSERRLGLRKLHGMKLYFRKASVDECVLTTEYQKARFFADNYNPTDADIILDVGAHIGAFTILAAQRAPRGTVHAIEPSSENFKILSLNVSTNRLPNVRTHRIVLSDTLGELRLYSGVDNWDHSLCTQSCQEALPDWERVPSQTLECFMVANGISRADYMKMNVEGAEYDILLKSPRKVVESVACMLIEFHPAEDHEGNEIFERLRMYGFTADMVESESDSGKGWITARRTAA